MLLQDIEPTNIVRYLHSPFLGRGIEENNFTIKSLDA